jgi:hypothetical protein
MRDNAGLSATTQSDTVVPVYVYDPAALGTVGKRQRAFLVGGGRAFDEQYRDPGPGATGSFEAGRRARYSRRWQPSSPPP